MDEDLRWAARMTFLEELWADRPRLILDAGLEAYLAAARDGDDEAAEPLRDLVARLLPAGPGPRTWMATHEEATGRELARTRPATGFVGLDMLSEVLEHRHWAVALIDLTRLVGPDAEEIEAGSDQARVSGRLPPFATRLLVKLGAAARAGRTVVIVLPFGEPESGRGFDDVGAVELLADALGGGRLYGLYRPPMAGVVDFGGADVVADDDDETVQIDPEEDVELTFDNTLGTQQPRVVEWLLVAGARGLSEGLTLLELPPMAAVDPLPLTLRAQLEQTQRHADRQAIEAHDLLERIDDLSRDNEALRGKVADLSDELARAVGEADVGPGAEADEDTAAALARAEAEVHQLKWRVGQLTDQLEAAVARPVDELQAEVEHLRARLAAAEAAAEASAPAQAAVPARPPAPPRPAFEADGVTPTRGLAHALGQIDALLVRLERGGLPNVRLREALLQLRGQLRRPPPS